LILDEFFFRSAAKVLLTSVWMAAASNSMDLLKLQAQERYSVIVNEKKEESVRASVGLCHDCRFKRLIKSDRGSTFYLCARSAFDASYPKYPRLPVLQCAGHEPPSEE
jgi:hypothetical protein